MWATAIHHIDMAGELDVLQKVVTSTVELVLGHSPDEAFGVEIMDELVAQFQKLEEPCSWLEQLDTRICDLLLRPAPDQARWANRLDETTGWLEVELTTRRLVDTKLEAVRTLAGWVWDLMLDSIDGPSPLAASLSMALKLLDGQIDATFINGVCWGTWSVLVAALSHFLELESKLGLLGSTRNGDLTEDQADCL
jgi:hypothetical protein